MADSQKVLTPTPEHRKRESSMEPCPPLLPKANVARRRIVQPPREVTAAPDDIGFRFFKDVFVHPYFCWSYRAFRRCENAPATRWADSFGRPTWPRFSHSGYSHRPPADERPTFLRRERRRAGVGHPSAGRHLGWVAASRHSKRVIGKHTGAAVLRRGGRHLLIDRPSECDNAEVITRRDHLTRARKSQPARSVIVETARVLLARR